MAPSDSSDSFAQRASHLAVSRMFLAYQHALTSAAGLPLRLFGVGGPWHQARVSAEESPRCVLLAPTNASCRTCPAMQREMEKEANEPRTFRGAVRSGDPRPRRTGAGRIHTFSSHENDALLFPTPR